MSDTTTTLDRAERAALRCAEQCKALDPSPVGTTPSVAGLLLVELALPWPKDVGDDPRLAEVREVAARHHHRLQALVPSGASPEGRAQLVAWTRPAPIDVGPDGDDLVADDPAAAGFDRFRRREALAPTGGLAEAAEALLAGPLPEGDQPDDVVDVLVCSHGSRDACCGKAGVPLFRDLGELAGPGVRVWRTSHLGGHRFAPTALTLPDGRAWAWVDAPTLDGIIRRSVPVAVAVDHDRGCGGMADPWQQAAEHAALAREGWAWLEARRSGATAEAPDSAEGHPRRQVHLTARRPDGTAVAYRAVVEAVRQVPVPVCGRPLDEAKKAEPDLRVVSMEEIPA